MDDASDDRPTRTRVNRAIVDALLGDDDPRELARTIGEIAGALATASRIEPAEILAIVHVTGWRVVDHLAQERRPS